MVTISRFLSFFTKTLFLHSTLLMLASTSFAKTKTRLPLPAQPPKPPILRPMPSGEEPPKLVLPPLAIPNR